MKRFHDWSEMTTACALLVFLLAVTSDLVSASSLFGRSYVTQSNATGVQSVVPILPTNGPVGDPGLGFGLGSPRYLQPGDSPSRELNKEEKKSLHQSQPRSSHIVLPTNSSDHGDNTHHQTGADTDTHTGSTHNLDHKMTSGRDEDKAKTKDKRVSGHQRHPRKDSTEIPVKRLPKAIIIGVKKAGTRALLEFLRIHPNIECSGPEPHYFDKNYHLGIDWYRDRMPVTYSDQLTIEKTPGYFVTKEAPSRIYAMDPNIKLLLVVRDPVTRSISDYCQAAEKHKLRPYEEMALLDEALGLVNTSWSAIKIGVYSKHLENWLRVFPLRQIHVVNGETLIDDPASELAKVEHFLGLSRFINESHFHLRGFKGKFPCLIKHGKPHCLGEKTKGREHPLVKESVLQRLQDFYRPFNVKFYQMVGENFGWT